MIKETCEEFCQLMANVKLKAIKSSINSGSDVCAVFLDSFVVERDLTDTEMKNMVETWIGMEDNKEEIGAIVDVDEKLDIF